MAVITWANDGGLWTDQVFINFKQHLEFTGIKIDTTIITWSIGKSKDSLTALIRYLQPDVIYFPQEHLYLYLAGDLARVCRSHFVVNNVEFDHEKMNLLPPERQSVISAKHDFDHLFRKVRGLAGPKRNIKKIGLLAPHYHRELIGKIRLAAVKQGLSLEVHHISSWKEYVDWFGRYENTVDAIFPLPPFEVLQDDKRIAMHHFRALINSSKVITIGYRHLGNIRRSIEVSITPAEFGKRSAYLIYDYLKGKKAADQFIDTHTMSFNFEHIRTLNLEMPKNQGSRFSLPEHRR